MTRATSSPRRSARRSRRPSEILHRHKIEKLPVVDADGVLRGLITVKDIQKRIQFPDATKDERGRLRVGAAVGVGPDAVERAEALVAAGVDVLVVDTAHGHSRGVLEMVRRLKSRFDVELIAGNVATAEADRGARSTPAPTRSRSASGPARSARRASSPASACRRSPRSTTAPRVAAAARHPGRSPTAACTYSGDIAKAIAAGADAVMLG